MSLMDGDEVDPGDKVWDMIDKWGVVHNVYEDSFTVKFGRRKRTVTYDGVVDGRTERSVYWGRTDYFIPRKNPLMQDRQRRAVVRVMEVINEVADTKIADVRKVE